MRIGVESRDLEILRTLVRVHFLTSAEINVAFFSSDWACYRRLRKLAALNLIRRHTNGAAPRSNYCAWRVTGRGIETVADAYPGEHIPQRLDERLARQSLANDAYREAVSRVYLDLILGQKTERPATPTSKDVRQWIAEVRGRANEVSWDVDDTLLMTYRSGEKPQLAPDAIATNDRVRVFIELDRSHKSLKRAKVNIESYGDFLRRFYMESYPDMKEPWVVYVCQTSARKASFNGLARKSLTGPPRCAVLLKGEETRRWLASSLFGEESELPKRPEGQEALTRAAKEVLSATNALLKSESDLFSVVSARQPKLSDAWRHSLWSVYNLVAAECGHGG
jgi:hypothetical protein